MEPYKFNIYEFMTVVFDTSVAAAPGSIADHCKPSLPFLPSKLDPKSVAVIDAAVTALDQHKRNEMDPHHFGHGVWIDGKWRPRRANPKHSPPLELVNYIDREGNDCTRRQYRAAGEEEHKSHVTGRRPLFDLNCANRIKRRWHIDKLPAMIVLCLPDHRGEDLADELGDITLLDTMLFDDQDKIGRGSIVTLSPDEALTLLHCKRSSARKLHRKVRDDDRFKHVKHALIDLQQDDGATLFWSVKRAIEDAIVLYLEPILMHEMVIDIDKVDGFTKEEQIQASKKLADRIVAEEFTPLGWTVFCEVSRNGKGRYIRFRIARELEPRKFNDLIGQFQRYLREKYNEDGLAAKVDKVGGRLLHYFHNPNFDKDTYDSVPEFYKLTAGARYNWLKMHHGINRDPDRPITWGYDTEMEPLDFAGGDLITKPLHGVLADPDGGQSRVDGYITFRNTDPGSESLLRSLFPVETGVDPLIEDEDDDEESKRSTTEKSGVKHRVKSGAKRDGKRSDEEIYLDPEANSQSRYNAAGRIVMRQQKPTDLNEPEQWKSLIEGILQKVEALGGPADGPRHPHRISRVEEIVSYLMPTFDISKTSKRGASPTINLPDPEINPAPFDELRQLIEARVSATLIHKANRSHRASINYHNLTMAFAGYLVGIHTKNLTEVPQAFIQTFCANRGVEMTKNDLAAARRILTFYRTDLLIQTAEYVGPHDPDGRRRQCSKFALHSNCPVPTWISDHITPIVIHAIEHADPITADSRGTVISMGSNQWQELEQEFELGWPEVDVDGAEFDDEGLIDRSDQTFHDQIEEFAGI